MLSTTVQNILNNYKSFNLAELDAADLLERKDFKYVFLASKFDEVLLAIAPYYKVLQVNNLMFTDYETHYYDTRDFRFFLQHHNGQANRYKIRLRNYIQSNLYFYEEKFKNNKNWTSKYRQKIPNMGVPIDVLTAHTNLPDLERKVNVFYTRITMLSNDHSEKLTFDLNLRFSDLNNNEAHYDDICIAEVKSKSHHPYIFRQVIKKMGYTTMGLSKYCFGIINLYQHIKSNNFKGLKKYITKLRQNELGLVTE